MSEKDDIIWFMNREIAKIRDVRSPISIMACEELYLLVEKYRRGELTLDELVSTYEEVAKSMSRLAIVDVNGMEKDNILNVKVKGKIVHNFMVGVRGKIVHTTGVKAVEGGKEK